jgi:hypothetical protein
MLTVIDAEGHVCIIILISIMLSVGVPSGVLIKINQMPFSAARWRHGFQMCSATFIQLKITNLLITQQPLKLEKK